MSLTVELDERTALVVQELAANEKRSASEVIHDALTIYACQAKQQPPAPGRRNLPTGVGKYRSGQPDIARNARDIIRQDVKEGRWP
jgi:hypothetical protein